MLFSIADILVAGVTVSVQYRTNKITREMDQPNHRKGKVDIIIHGKKKWLYEIMTCPNGNNNNQTDLKYFAKLCKRFGKVDKMLKVNIPYDKKGGDYSLYYENGFRRNIFSKVLFKE